MTRKICKGTELKVFSGREARLNRITFLVLSSKSPLTSYDIYLGIRRIKGFRHVKWRSIDRRIKALYAQGWIIKCGTLATLCIGCQSASCPCIGQDRLKHLYSSGARKWTWNYGRFAFNSLLKKKKGHFFRDSAVFLLLR